MPTMTAFARRLVLATGAAALLGAASPAQVQGAQSCGKRADLISFLAGGFREAPVGIGLTEQGLLLEIFASKDGETWTLLMTMPNGVACVVASGEQWQAAPLIADGGRPA